MAEVLEMIMVICFGISWPISIIKTLKVKCSTGKSPIFILCIVIGYVCGIISKIVGDNITYVFWFYWLNLCMTSTDLGLLLYYRHKEKKNK